MLYCSLLFLTLASSEGTCLNTVSLDLQGRRQPPWRAHPVCELRGFSTYLRGKNLLDVHPMSTCSLCLMSES